MAKGFDLFRTICLAFLLGLLVACGGGSDSSSAPRTAAIEGIYTDGDNLARQDDADLIAADVSSVIDIYGTDLNPGLQVSLGGESCQIFNLQYPDTLEQSDNLMDMSVSCPAKSVGSYAFKIVDRGVTIYESMVEVVTSDTLAQTRAAAQTKIRPAYSSAVDPLSAGSQSLPGISVSTLSQEVILSPVANSVTGQITAERPAISTTNGSLDYSRILKLAVRGVVVQLLDAANGNAEIASTATDASGVYVFSHVPSDRSVIVRVKAQIARNRAVGDTNTAQYNVMLRDNTQAGKEKPLYTMESAGFTTQAAGNVVSLNAQLGFNDKGVSNGPRQSAPYAILDVVYNAVSKIVETNPGVTLKDMNIYWSVNNRTGGSDSEEGKLAGNIETSHFQPGTDYPGLFILGQANVDTDEFDSGVVGHEFGHYLQEVASYSDSPGDGHSASDFKDASLSYGEGFGTAIGGLLSKSYFYNASACLTGTTCTNLYTDSSGTAQASGFITDLNKKPATGYPNGFYAEDSVGYLLYKLGIDNGFSPFWKTLTAMAQGYESATVFNFLDKYVGQQSALSRAQLLTLAKGVNIKTTDPLGVLPAGTAADTAIDEDASGGADDLETLYFMLAPSTPIGVVEQNLTANPPTFCMNAKLAGEKKSNGLGVSRRFKVVSPYTGTMGIKLQDANTSTYMTDSYRVNVRAGDTGKEVDVAFWGIKDENSGQYPGRRWPVKAGVAYTILVNFQSEVYKQGNVCGNKLYLWQAAQD